MKPEAIFDAVGCADDDLLIRCRQDRHRKSKRIFRASVAVCFLLVFSVTVFAATIAPQGMWSGKTYSVLSEVPLYKYRVTMSEELGDYRFADAQIYHVSSADTLIEALLNPTYEPLEIRYDRINQQIIEVVNSDASHTIEKDSLHITVGTTAQSYWTTYFNTFPENGSADRNTDKIEYKGLTLYRSAKLTNSSDVYFASHIQIIDWADEENEVCFHLELTGSDYRGAEQPDALAYAKMIIDANINR